MRRLILFIAAISLLSSCSNNVSKIKGEFSNLKGKTVYLERLDVGTSEVIDTVKATEDGAFKFKIKFGKDQSPSFYLVKVDGDNFITLFVEPGETIRIKGNALQLESSYEVSGSKASEDIRTLSQLLNGTISTLDSLDAIRLKGVDSVDYKMGKAFVTCKREFIKYIISNPKSMASLYAIYSQLPGNESVFGTTDDINYFKLLSDSLSVAYPKSPYVVSLKNHYGLMAQNAVIGDIFASRDVKTIGVPDIALPNAQGQEVKLSDLKGRVVLVDFWDPADQTSLENNLGLVQVYNKYKDKGFIVYQVSLATKAPWLAAIDRQNLEWISVSDFLGANSPAATIYNVKSIPANFLIDRNGDLVGKDLFGRNLEVQINKALK